MYHWGKPIIGSLLRMYNRMEVIGQEKIPQSSGYVVVANHQNYLDPFYVGAILPHQPFFMAKKEAFDHRFLGPILRGFEAFPVNRKGNDMKAIKHGIKLLKEGKVLGIFPEGGRRQNKDFGDLKLGAAYFSMKTDRVIVPMYIDGSERALPKINGFPRPVKIKIYVGDPLEPNEFEDYKAMGGELHYALLNLKKQATQRDLEATSGVNM